jgi:hypothetical protein
MRRSREAKQLSDSIKKFHKKMSIPEIARQLNMNRNTVAKYPGILLIPGQVGAKKYGILKVYTLSRRVPVSAMMDFSSDMSMVDKSNWIIHADARLIQFACIQRDTLI